MATETFPTLSMEPGYPAGEQISNLNFLTSKAEAGYVHGRKRYTKNRKLFKRVYPGVPTTDKALLDTFIALVGTAIDFDWTDVVDDTAYEVRFVQIPVLTKVGPDVWRVSFQLLTI